MTVGTSGALVCCRHGPQRARRGRKKRGPGGCIAGEGGGWRAVRSLAAGAGR
ncbi:MAG: hypothetical protein LBM74_10205 [Oscillospiraceae bacterium]|nr:hypothetical protein [Oscillospiraceae bacterium]